MFEEKQVIDMYNGDQIEGFYLLKEAEVKTSSLGKQYLDAALSDASGEINAKLWDYSEGMVGPEARGTVVKVRGEVQDYKGSPQLKIMKIRKPVPTDVYNLADIVASAPIDVNEEMAYINDVIESIEDEDYKKICVAMIQNHLSTFRIIPAAKAMHHAFIGGLLMHTSNMVRSAEALADIYSEAVDRSLLLAGTILHDLSKDREFEVSEIGLVSDYTPVGKLLGHLVMGADEVMKTAGELGVSEEKAMVLAHLILSHHGEPEFGAAVVPQTAESELLHYIDMIDSRMEIYAEELPGLEPGKFSDKKIYSLDHAIYRIR